ncbi:expressed unknown protein [Seminavis robusta]|uniref:Uncharacterized protein n=1 Tax=Seminavis robusta TaxID=568900 RepID=A0A9N8ELS0_9STRA|nr:expressed unknown protein [Seminavis robusta]|eukprot:Sro1190_g250790.1 n/a (241) ;mRNA; f:15384-16106
MTERDSHQEQQSTGSTGWGLSGLTGNKKEDDSLCSKAIEFARTIRTQISESPHKVVEAPYVPHGFLEGAEVGCMTYFLLKPIGNGFMGLVTGSPQLRGASRPIGLVVTIGQLMVGAQMALYAAVRKGSHTWLSTLEQVATSTTTTESSDDNNWKHKAIMADALCRDPLMASIQQQLLAMTQQQQEGGSQATSTTNEAGSPPSVKDWVMDADKVVTDQLIRTVAACNQRNSPSSQGNTEFQ